MLPEDEVQITEVDVESLTAAVRKIVVPTDFAYWIEPELHTIVGNEAIFTYKVFASSTDTSTTPPTGNTRTSRPASR